MIVRNGVSESSNILGKYCGNKVPVFLISTGNELSLNFRTNGINHAKGFEISWMSYYPRLPSEPQELKGKVRFGCWCAFFQFCFINLFSFHCTFSYIFFYCNFVLFNVSELNLT